MLFHSTVRLPGCCSGGVQGPHFSGCSSPSLLPAPTMLPPVPGEGWGRGRPGRNQMLGVTAIVCS